MSKPLTLYHWAPRARRASIRRDGLRRCSWNGGALVTFAASVHARTEIRSHVAERHHCAPEQLDLWRLTVPAGRATHWARGVYVLSVDLTPDSLTLLGDDNE